MTVNVNPCTYTLRMSRLVAVLGVCLVLPGFGVGQGRNCNPEEPCLGGRPRDHQECCLGLRGDDCGYDAEEGEPPGYLCDTLLGYHCEREAQATQGICTGQYNLRASNIEQNAARLDWEDFAPENYTGEYGLSIISHTFTANHSEWRTNGIGSLPHYQLSDLKAWTLYFIRIGVYAPGSFTSYMNETETLVFRTLPVENCVYDHISYEVGKVYEVACEDICTCMPTGVMNCTDICDYLPPLPDPERCVLERRNATCCAWKVVCAPVMAACVHTNGRHYEHGETFTEGECLECMCRNGTILCDFDESCQKPNPTLCPNPIEVEVEGQCCPEWRCSASTCEDDGETFENGAQWQKENPCVTCNCEEGHAACYSHCVEPIPPENCARPRLTKLTDSCCDVYECLPEEGQCFYEAKNFTQGTFLSNSRCELCVCNNSAVLCQAKQCPKVIIPPASIFCPNPHVRKDNCCPTLWCEKQGQDVISVIKYMFGTSYGPHSVTLSFMEDDGEPANQAEENENEEGEEGTTEGSSAETKYELQYCSSEDLLENGTSVWQTRTFEPRYLHFEDEPVASPSRLLQTTGAIRVGKRVYVTVSGIEANTTYYLKVLVISSDPQDRPGQSQPQSAGVIAVRTQAEVIPDPCPGSCPSEEVMMIPSSTCPRPVLEKPANSCCSSWKCYPQDGDCHYKNMILKNGEHFREHCERTCRCVEGNITCRPTCGDPGEAPRPGCALETLQDHCCSVWMCPPRTMPVESMSFAVSLEYEGKCLTKQTTFKSKFQTSVKKVIGSVPECETGSPLAAECTRADVGLTCPFVGARGRPRRELDNIKVDVYITSNVSADSIDSVKDLLTKLATALFDIFNRTKPSVSVDAEEYKMYGPPIVTSPTGDCSFGYVFKKNVCVEGITTSATTLDIPLHVSTSSNSAVLAWQSLRTPKTRYVTGLQIEYREEEEVAYNPWNQTAQLDPGVTRHELTSLHAARSYKARLVVFTNIIENNRVRLTPIRFETKPFGRNMADIRLLLEEVSVSQTTATLRWTPLPEDVSGNLIAMEIRYGHVSVQTLLGEGDQTGVITKSIATSATSVTITGLTSSTTYVAHIIVYFTNNTVGSSGTIHLVTMATDKSENLLVPLLVSAVIVVCAVAIVVITCCLWRRSKREVRETAFENKTFGLHIENDGRILNVRP